MKQRENKLLGEHCGLAQLSTVQDFNVLGFRVSTQEVQLVKSTHCGNLAPEVFYG